MKTKQLLIALTLVLCLPLTSFKTKPSDSGTYYFLYVNGCECKYHHFLVSKIGYKPASCKTDDLNFFKYAERKFKNYTKAYLTDEVYGDNDIQHQNGFSSSGKAQEAITELIAKTKAAGNKVVYVDDIYTCE